MELRNSWSFSGMLLRKNPSLRWDFLRLLLLAVLLLTLKLGAAVSVLLLYQETPMALLTKAAPLWRPVQLLLWAGCGVIWCICSWPVLLRCVRAAGMAESRPVSRGKMLQLAAWIVFIRTVLLQGTSLCLFGAYQLAYVGTQRTEAAPWLFFAVQLTVLSVVCLLWEIYVHLGMLCAPFLYFSQPDSSVWRIPFQAMGVMRGERKALLLQLGWYLLLMLPVVTIPWVLPRAGLAMTVFFEIRMQQE